MKTKIFTAFFQDYNDKEKVQKLEDKVNNFTKKKKGAKITWLQSMTSTSFKGDGGVDENPGGTAIYNRITAVIDY